MGEITRDEYHQIAVELGISSPDKRMAKFSIAPVIDAEASSGDARRKANEEAELKSERLGKLVDVDYSSENLKRLGARTIYKDQLMVTIKHPGVKDYKTRIATAEDKVTFVKAWEAFKASQKEPDGHDVRLLPGVTESIAMELAALNVQTVEDIAAMNVPDQYQSIKSTAMKFMELNNVTDREEITGAGNGSQHVREKREPVRSAPDRQQEHQEFSSWGGHSIGADAFTFGPN